MAAPVLLSRDTRPESPGCDVRGSGCESQAHADQLRESRRSTPSLLALVSSPRLRSELHVLLSICHGLLREMNLKGCSRCKSSSDDLLNPSTCLPLYQWLLELTPTVSHPACCNGPTDWPVSTLAPFLISSVGLQPA